MNEEPKQLWLKKTKHIEEPRNLTATKFTTDNSRKIILYRKYEVEYEELELEEISLNFPITPYITDIKEGDLVIGRYSVLPFYKSLAEDISNIGANLINSYEQHYYVANMGNWYSDLEEFTPKSWPGLSWIDEEGPYILKGQTNSIRQKWKSHMYAEDLKAAQEVYRKLNEESSLAGQMIWIRKFENLKSYGTQVTGLPISDEYRFFICDGQILSGGYYWSACLEESKNYTNINAVPYKFLRKVIDIIGNRVRFYSLDVAQRQDGEWIVIELNDGQMSGLSANEAKIVFGNLSMVLQGKNSEWEVPC